MAQRTIFHIGLHKTATTSLQVDTFPRVGGINYLPMSLGAVRDYIDLVLACDPIYYPSSTKSAGVKALLTSDKPNLISCEALSGPAWAGVAQRGIDHRAPVLQNLAHDFSDADILLILRRQDGYARSMYRQYVKTGGTHSMARFLGADSTESAPLFSHNRFRYAPFVGALDTYFSGNVHVMFFEEFRADSRAFLTQLATVLGCSDDIPEPGQRNSSRLGSRGLQVSRVLNRLFRGTLNPGAPFAGVPLRRNGRWAIENPVALLQDHWPGKAPKQSAAEQKLCADLLNACAEDNRRLADHLGRDLSAFGYY